MINKFSQIMSGSVNNNKQSLCKELMNNL